MRLMKQFLKRLICKFKGHRYPASAIMPGCALYFCERCGKEMFDRTFDDLREMGPMTDEEQELFMSDFEGGWDA